MTTRNDGAASPPPNAGAPWTEREDRILVFYGFCLETSLQGEPGHGYRFVTLHDLHRDPEEGPARMEVLRRERPDFVAAQEREAASAPDDEPEEPQDDEPQVRCVNAHDRCHGGAGGPCPYCERVPS